MVLYTCKRCLKEFNLKDSFIKHTQRRKKPCEIHESLIQINPIQHIEILNNDKNFCCNYCNKCFFNNANLNKHLRNNSCKVKKLQDKEKDNTLKLLLEKEEEIKKINEENQKNINRLENYIKEQNIKFDKFLNLSSPVNKNNC